MRVVLLVLLAGCRSLLGFEELSDPIEPDGASSDGPSSDGTPSDAPSDAFAKCPSTYATTISSSASVYRIVNNVATPWLTANQRCLDDHPRSHLITLSSALELADILDAAGTGVPVRWVGLSDRVTDDVFIPVTDEQVTFPPASGPPWAAGEPMVGTNADCIAINAGQLVSLACGNGRQFICECDDFASDPTKF